MVTTATPLLPLLLPLLLLLLLLPLLLPQGGCRRMVRRAVKSAQWARPPDLALARMLTRARVHMR